MTLERFLTLAFELSPVTRITCFASPFSWMRSRPLNENQFKL